MSDRLDRSMNPLPAPGASIHNGPLAVREEGRHSVSSAKHREYRKAATRAGLRYVTDGFAGISRRRSGKGWSYFDPGGVRIGDPLTRKRLNTPPPRQRVERDRGAGDLTRHQLLATVVRLLDKTLIRVGNDEYARENRSYGLTTLRRKHVQVEGTLLRFSFRGKSGVEHTVAVNDLRLARIVQRRHDLPRPETFPYLDAAGQ